MSQIKILFSYRLHSLISKWLLFFISLALISFYIAYFNWGLGQAALFLGISVMLKAIANSIKPGRQSVIWLLNRGAVIFLAGGLSFYGLIYLYSMN
jgi:hypothetical protein